MLPEASTQIERKKYHASVYTTKTRGGAAASRKVVGSIPDGVIGIFHWHNPSGRTVALGLTQPLTEVSTRNFPEG